MPKASKEGLNRHEIMAAIRMKGSSFAAIARDHGLKRQTMYWAQIRPHPRANAAIADFLGVPLCELWPEWFDADGKLISTAALPRPSAQPIPTASFRSRLRRRAA
ncbi:helix-turn-helix domain-containing protein [Methylocystis heyeri]|uniref:helix-turn-helix domain-containing protein n=1 Tax=Methylocystis heyeri TaxID=391905 RepID=UPI00113D81D9|nr:helix-turn-helix domain-containing protein [Methylocystis heyeri]